jgi:hypothetical protein
MRKWFVGAAAFGILAAVAMPRVADAAQRSAHVGAKPDPAIEVGSQYRRAGRAHYRPSRAYYQPRAYYRPYRAYARPLYGARYFAPGFYPAWSTYSDYGYGGYGYGGYGYTGYGYGGGYGYGYRPFISVGVPGFSFWF